jgi:transcriptional antiterminator RfaH
MSSVSYKWHVVYTNPRAEKKVYQLLEKNRIEAFLPLKKTLKVWSDRKKWVEEPLFNSYVFVFVSEKEYMQVLQIPGIVRYITFSGKAATVPDTQIGLIRRLLMSDAEMEISEHVFKPGERVKVNAGQLMGLEGELVSLRSEKRFLVRIHEMDRSLLLNISAAFLEPAR